MDFFSKIAKPEQPPSSAGDKEPSSGLFDSIKVVAGAAQSHFSKEPATYDNAKVAGATADLLGAASDYGKLDKTQGVGQYVEQAENYLNEYKSSHTTAPPPAAATKPAEEASEKVSTDPVPATTTKEIEAVEEPVKTEAAEKIPSGGDVAADDISDKPSGDDDVAKSDVSDVPKEDLSKKPTIETDPVEVSDGYPKGTEEVLKEEPVTGAAATISKSGEGELADDKSEIVSEKPSAVPGNDIAEKISDFSKGDVNFSKLAGGYFK